MLDLHLFLGRPVKIATGASKQGLFHICVTSVFNFVSCLVFFLYLRFTFDKLTTTLFLDFSVSTDNS